jgi:tetratricopeptide (TPR) repeat protein
MRIQWSYWFSQNPDVKVCIPSKRIFLDASKLGIMPSSIHANNMLIFNREFVELTKIAALQEKDLKTKMKEAEQLYTAVLHMNSPDVMSVYGGILMKSGKLNEAKIMFMNALEILKVHNCKVNSAGDLYQNLINIHEKLQTDVAKITSQPSIYDDKDMAKADLS